jgi:hypothetical protein
MHEGRLRTGLRIAVSTAIGLSLALTANYLTLAQPQPGQTSPARDPDSAPPYPLEGEAVSKPPDAPATPHTVVCSERGIGDIPGRSAATARSVVERCHVA